MLILQESCTDPTASFVIYAPVDIVAMNVVLNGGDPDYVALLPSGFAILPDGTSLHGANIGEAASGGSLLTVAFQILVDSVPTAKLSLGSVATVNNLIACTVERIKASLSCESAWPLKASILGKVNLLTTFIKFLILIDQKKKKKLGSQFPKVLVS